MSKTIKIKISAENIPQIRNPFVRHLINRAGNGAHSKPYKTERQKNKAALRRGEY